MTSPVAICLQFLTLVTLFMLLVLHIPKRQIRIGPGLGNLSVYVYRVISESSQYDVLPPNLYLEVESGGVKKVTGLSNHSRELVLNREFVFERADFLAVVMMRVRDATALRNMSRSLLVLSPAEVELNRTSIFKADELNWYVVRLNWVKEQTSIGKRAV